MRNVFILLLALMILLGQAACGKTTEPPATTPPVTKAPATQPPETQTPAPEPSFSIYFAPEAPEAEIIAEYSDGGQTEYLTELVLVADEPATELDIVAIGMAEDGFYVDEILQSVGNIQAGQGIALKLALMDMPTRGISCADGGERALFEVNTSARDGEPYAGRLEVSTNPNA